MIDKDIEQNITVDDTKGNMLQKLIFPNTYPTPKKSMVDKTISLDFAASIDKRNDIPCNI